ncbi:hypothetical protein ElyMa_001029600, partial [Elysia marginata]
DALYMLRTVWGKVTEATVANCFRHVGFKQQESIEENNETSEEPTADSGETKLFDLLKDLVKDEVSAEAF